MVRGAAGQSGDENDHPQSYYPEAKKPPGSLSTEQTGQPFEYKNKNLLFWILNFLTQSNKGPCIMPSTKLKTAREKAIEIVEKFIVTDLKEADRLLREGVSEELQLNGSSNARGR